MGFNFTRADRAATNGLVPPVYFYLSGFVTIIVIIIIIIPFIDSRTTSAPFFKMNDDQPDLKTHPGSGPDTNVKSTRPSSPFMAMSL